MVKDQSGELKELLAAQKALLSRYEAIVATYESNEFAVENRKLKDEVNALKKENKEIKDSNKKLNTEATAAKGALREQILSERMQFIEKSEDKLEIYFKKECSKTIDELGEIEEKLKIKLKAAGQRAVNEAYEELVEQRDKINTLAKEIDEIIARKKKETRDKQARLADEINTEYKKLKEEPISKEVLEKRIKANNIEVKIGLNWINKAGMFLILIGIVTAMRYSFKYFFSNEVKGIFGLVLGMAFLLGGEYCAKKGKRIFSQGMIGGGIGILYITVFCSYFLLNIINMLIALIMAILISITSFVLSLRYDSRTIGCFALIGGYLPLLAYSLMDGGLRGQVVYLSMGYVLILNVVTLLISSRRSWSVLDYLSYFTNIPASIYLAFAAEETIIGIIYSVITFLLYMVIILGSLIKEKSKLIGGKVFVIGCNTLISCVVICTLFVNAGLRDWLGLVALIFAVIYYALSRYIERQTKKEKILPVLFNITALTFAILVMPLQFDKEYLSLGWLIEGILFIGYGLKMNNKILERAGKIIFGLCLTVFYLDIRYFLYDAGVFEEIRYASIVLGSVGVLVMYIIKNRKAIAERNMTNGWFIGYKYLTLGSVWLYLLRMAFKMIEEHEGIAIGYLPLKVLCFSLIFALLISLIKRVKWLQDAMSYVVVIVGCIILDGIGIIYNAIPYVFIQEEAVNILKPAAIVVMILWNIVVLINLSSLIKEVIVRAKYSVELYPMALAIVLMANMTTILGIQFNLGIGSVIISIFYIVSAFAMIGVGFRFGYRKLRYLGLGLSLFALGKLFLFDFTMGVSTIYKIISFFGFGIVLLVISYLYQKFSKYMEKDTMKLIEEASEKSEEADEIEVHNEIHDLYASDDDDDLM